MESIVDRGQTGMEAFVSKLLNCISPQRQGCSTVVVPDPCDLTQAKVMTDTVLIWVWGIEFHYLRMSPSKLKLLAWEEPPSAWIWTIICRTPDEKLAPAYPPDRAL